MPLPEQGEAWRYSPEGPSVKTMALEARRDLLVPAGPLPGVESWESPLPSPEALPSEASLMGFFVGEGVPGSGT